MPVLKDATFQDWIKTNYAISTSSLVAEFTDELISKEYDNA